MKIRSGLLIYNPTAGSFPSGLLAERVVDVLQHHSWRVDLVQSTSGEHITDLARQAAQNHLDAVFIAGGDGSVHLAMNGLVGTQTALGVLPAGTSNVLAQELGLTTFRLFRGQDLEQNAELLAQGDTYLADVGNFNGSHFLLWAGIGLDGFIVHRIEPREPWEKQFSVMYYASKAVWNIHYWNGMHLKARVGDTEIDGQYLMALMSNVRLYAGGLTELSPNACLDDGVMDLWLIEGETPVEAYQQAIVIMSGRHLNSEQIRCIPFSHLTIESEKPMYTQLDAEPYHGHNHIEVNVHPRSLRVIVPKKMDKPLFMYPPIHTAREL
jgi:diacylglycerol kinase (ATP)